MNEAGQLYQHRSLTEGYPNLQQIGSEYYTTGEDQTAERDVSDILKAIHTLVQPTADGRRAVVVGCGPNPRALKHLLQNGYDAVGVEPIEPFVSRAQQAVNEARRVLLGCAENLPLDDDSQQVVWMESVLEHVDSVEKSLAEAYRVLAPGGVLYVQTTNRWRFSILGRNQEFRIPFFNWFPDLVKECYVFSHLHYKPHLANYATRPAVHWFSYPDLCRFGREAGFAQFYSLLDVLPSDNPRVRKSLLRRTLFGLVRRNHWLKALALSQVGGTVFMWKRAK
jgi:SAM-dependent methyltransferase